MKPGWKTSEFWLSLAATVVGLLTAAGVVVEGSTLAKIVGLVAGLLGALGYTVVRGAIKNTERKATALEVAAKETGTSPPS